MFLTVISKFLSLAIVSLFLILSFISIVCVVSTIHQIKPWPRNLTEVRAVYDKKKWMKSTIKAAVHQHWRCIRDDNTRKTKHSFENHRRQINRRQINRSNRLKRKLSRRLSCLDTSTVLSEGDKRRAREILSSPDALHYISSEESCEDNAVELRSGPRPRKIRKLLWKKSKLGNIKAKLDEAYLAGLTEKQRRTSARTSAGLKRNHHANTLLTALVGQSAATNSPHFQNLLHFIHTSCKFFV